MSELAILYEDPHLIAVNKPAPLLTQAPEGVPSLESLVKAYIKAKYAKPGGVYLGVPHRLDRPVSGAIVFARNTKAAQRVHAQFHERLVRKVYWAMVEGTVTPEAGVWEDWLRKVPDESRTVRADANEPGAKQATLEFRVLNPIILPSPLGGEGLGVRGKLSTLGEDCLPGEAFPSPLSPLPQRERGTRSFLELSPLTGRMHQLRAQTSLRGHPVLGDSAYGSARDFGPPAELPRDRVIALHARRLTLTHPFTKQELVIEAPLPAYWSCGPSEATPAVTPARSASEG